MAIATRNIIAIDLGAESGRVMLTHFDGQRLSLEAAHRFPNKSVRTPAHLHWNVLALWDEIVTGLGHTAKHGDVASIGIDTWAIDFALLDASGELLGNPVCYRDARTDGMMDVAFARVPRERIFDATGIQFMPINTLYQLVAMAKAKAPALDAARSLLMVPDLLNYWLTGVQTCEFTNATSTQMFDPRQGDWARDVLNDLGVPQHFLLPVTQPGTTLGKLSPMAARLIDSSVFAQTRVIAPATHDTGSAVAGTPLASPRSAYISSGTWSLLGAVVEKPVITPQALQFNFTNEGGLHGTFRLLKNISGMWLVQECRRAWANAGDAVDYATLFAEAKLASAFAALIDPDDVSFAHPADMPIAISGYCIKTQQAAPRTRGEFTCCILESLALKYRHVLGQLEQLLGHEVDVIHVVGGGSQNALLCQFTADACNRPVVAGPTEATAIGNVVVQLIASGELGSMDDAREAVRNSFGVTHYEPHTTALWDEAYGTWLRRTATSST